MGTTRALLLSLLAALGLPQAAAAGDQAAEVFSLASPSVYSILAEQRSGHTSMGSGVVVGDGRIVTNYHVVNGADRIRVKRGQEEVEAVLETGDKAHDLALLQAPGIAGPAARVGSSGAVRIGQTVYAIGSPRGLELSLSEGLISSLRETPDGNTLQTTAPISPGSSGGGLFDAQARLIGFTTAQVINGQNLNFAVPVEWLRFVGVHVQPGNTAATAAVEPARAEEPAAAPAVADADTGAGAGVPARATAESRREVASSPNLYIGTALIALLLIGAKPAIERLSDYLARDDVPAQVHIRPLEAALQQQDRLLPFRTQAREEVKSGQRDADTWLSALEASRGDEIRATVAYIEARTQALHRADMDRRWQEMQANQNGLLRKPPSA